MAIRALLAHGMFFSLTSIALSQQPSLEVALKKLNDQPLPVQVVSGTIHSFGFVSEVVATTSAPKDTVIKNAEFYLVIFNSGKVVGGEGWVESNPSSIVHQTKLPLHDGDEAILLVDSVATTTRTFALSKVDITGSVMHLIQGEAYTLPPIQISMLPTGDFQLKRVQGGMGDFCTAALSASAAACNGGGGLASFSCSASTQNFSFSCKGAPITPVKPAE
jgi:hypothetical protein